MQLIRRMVVIGIDLGGTNIKAALIDRQNGFINTVSVPTNADLGKEYVFDRIEEVVAELVSHSKEQPIGIGMGLPGMVSMDRKIVKYPPNLPGWKVERVSEELQKRTGLDTVIENDANLAALGSARFGAGKDFDNFVMITLGTGVGGGIIHQNKIFRGTTGMAGELGHVIIDYHGPLSNSNTRGGIEAYLGQRFLSRFAADTIRQDTENPLYIRFHRDFDKLEPIDLYHAAKEGNELAIEILRKSGEKLGYAIVNYLHILDFRKVIVRSEAYLGQRFLSRFAADTIRQDTENPLYIRFHRDFDKLEPIDLYHAAKEGNELAIEILRKSGEKLGYAIVNYLHILDFRKVIVSGGVANAGDFILQPARDTARRLLMPPFTEGFEIIVESLGNEAALLGAASLAFEEL